VEFVERKDAAVVLKQILEQCKVLDRTDISLNTNSSPEGYQLQIRIPVDEATKQCLSDVLSKANPSQKKRQNPLVRQALTYAVVSVAVS
jgi:hypothetical protein